MGTVWYCGFFLLSEREVAREIHAVNGIRETVLGFYIKRRHLILSGIRVYRSRDWPVSEECKTIVFK